jgi:hypothetical protein
MTIKAYPLINLFPSHQSGFHTNQDGPVPVFLTSYLFFHFKNIFKKILFLFYFFFYFKLIYF